MQVKITYCTSWSYRPRAFRVKEEIEEAYKDAEFELLKGSGGNFIVEVNGKILFSKNELENPRFPKDGEILDLINRSKPA